MDHSQQSQEYIVFITRLNFQSSTIHKVSITSFHKVSYIFWLKTSISDPIFASGKASAFAGSDGRILRAAANLGSVQTVDARKARQGGFSEVAWQRSHDAAYVPQGRPMGCWLKWGDVMGNGYGMIWIYYGFVMVYKVISIVGGRGEFRKHMQRGI